jgi:hypothetical protein
MSQDDPQNKQHSIAPRSDPDAEEAPVDVQPERSELVDPSRGVDAQFPGDETQQTERVSQDLDREDEHRIASEDPRQAEFERDREQR